MTDVLRITTARAILDWINRPLTLADAERLGDGAGEAKQRILPGVVGRTKYRVMWELTPQIARLFIAKMAEALEDPSLSVSMRDAIVFTKKQVEEQCEALLVDRG